MPLLLLLSADEWQLEVAGPFVAPPDFLPSRTSTYTVNGNAQLQLYSAATGGLTDAQEGTVETQPLFFENATYDFYLRSANPAITLSLPVGAVRAHKTGDLTHQAINFGNDVGFSEIRVTGSRDVTLRLEVFPTKLDYRIDYVRMRDEVSRTIRNLAMAVQTRTFTFASPYPSADRTLNEWIELLRHYFQELMRAGQSIARSSHSRLVRFSENVPIEKSKRADIRRLERKVRSKSAQTIMSLPRRIPELRRKTSFDTPENRYIKYLLLRTAHNLRTVLNTRTSGDEDAESTAEQRFFDAFRPNAREMLQQVQALLREDFLKDIQPAISDVAASLVLLKHPSYLRFIKLARLFNGGLCIDGQVLRVGIKNIALLYEYWCFLTLLRLLSERFSLEQQSLIRYHHTGIVVTLAKGVQASVQFRDHRSGRKLDVIYDRAFKHLPTITQRPDNVIQVASEQRLHILDAKYRLAYDQEYRTRFGGVGPTPEDVNTMHRYRDAIVAPEPSDSTAFRRIIISASVLFPYSDESKYASHRFHQSLAQVHIGGVPFLPGTSSLFESYLGKLLAAEGYVINTA